jgi:hypothetical protein
MNTRYPTFQGRLREETAFWKKEDTQIGDYSFKFYRGTKYLVCVLPALCSDSNDVRMKFGQPEGMILFSMAILPDKDNPQWCNPDRSELKCTMIGTEETPTIKEKIVAEYITLDFNCSMYGMIVRNTNWEGFLKKGVFEGAIK